MPALVIVGAQWGDEGKGKITDYLASEADAVVRYQGGNNAGHTVIVGSEKYKLHLVPSGILYAGTPCVLGNGVVVDLPGLVGELVGLKERGVDTSQLFVSEAAHCILPYHKALDQAQEADKGASKIGTTGRGIGPAYRDKVNRQGIRVCDLRHPHVLSEKLAANQREKQGLLTEGAVQWERIAAELLAAYEQIRDQVGDASARINDLLTEGRRVLFEGAQGTFLDIDHGTYPYVTSSTPTAGGACVGSGVGPRRIDHVVGVCKAYSTRVGRGPFPSELNDAVGEKLGELGHEFGTTTGRARRCGWLDAVMLRYAVQVNGLDSLAVTKLDVLDTFAELKVCVAYEIDGQRCESFPVDPVRLDRATPIYETVPGWNESTVEARSVEALPKAARDYLERIADIAGVPVSLVSVGPGRSNTIARTPLWEMLGGTAGAES